MSQLIELLRPALPVLLPILAFLFGAGWVKIRASLKMAANKEVLDSMRVKEQKYRAQRLVEAAQQKHSLAEETIRMLEKPTAEDVEKLMRERDGRR